MSYEVSCGWVDRPGDVDKTIDRLFAEQRASPLFAAHAGLLAEEDDGKDRFLWTLDEKVRGKPNPPRNQLQVGTCVSFGWACAIDRLVLLAAVLGIGSFPGFDVATEPIYGGSRVEVGGGRINGDGSVGAWAADWVRRWGVLLRKLYLDRFDLSEYSQQKSRDWGRRGVPDELEPIAKEHPVKSVAQCRDADSAWAALGNWYGIPICSNRGFTDSYKKGFCDPKGVWNHCMCIVGRFTHPSRGKCFVIENSWGEYIRSGSPTFEASGGEVALPHRGMFCTTADVVDYILRQGDSFVPSAMHNFPPNKIDWNFFSGA